MSNRIFKKYNAPTRELKHCTHCGRAFGQDDDRRNKYCKKCRILHASREKRKIGCCF